MPSRIVYAFLLVVAAGCRQPATENRNSAFQRACGAYLDGKYADAARLFGEARATSRGRQSQEAAYWQGRSLLAQQRPAEAREAFQAALAGDVALRRQALIGLASALAADPNQEEAKRQLQSLREKYGDEWPAASAAIVTPSSPAPAVKNSSAPAAKAVRFIVQVGSAYRDLAAAEEMAGRVRRAGFDCFVKKIAAGGRNAYMVQAGAFSSQEVAEAQARRLRSRGLPAMVR